MSALRVTKRRPLYRNTRNLTIAKVPPHFWGYGMPEAGGQQRPQWERKPGRGRYFARQHKAPSLRELLAVEKVFFEYFLGAAHASLSVAKLWSASEVQELSAWEGALPLPFPRFFEKNRVKLLILRTFLRHFNASADSCVSTKLVFRQSKAEAFGSRFCLSIRQA